MKAHKDPTENTIVVRSSAFGMNGMIPIEFTQDGDNAAPPLEWSAVPDGTRSIAIICEDPDAPTRVFTHWIVVGIPPTVTRLDASHLPPEAALGLNDFGDRGWGGPKPPSGRHRYFFKLFALDINLDKPDLTKQALYAAMKGHILARGELVGTYERTAAHPPGRRAHLGSNGPHARRH